MAALDPTGFLAAAVQRLAVALEEEIRNVVSFRNAFDGLLKELEDWKPTLQALADVTDNDLSLNLWLEILKKWMEKSESLVQDCHDVEQGCTCNSMYHICRKRELSRSIVDIRQDFKNIMKQLKVLHIVKELPKKEPKSYLKQVIPDQLVSMDEQLKDIKRMLISASNNKWVGVWGQGGSGKTIIAKQVNNSDEVDKFFPGGIFFVIVGGAANRRNLLQELCRLVKCEFNEQDPEQTLQSVLCTALKNKKVLLILDNVWDSRILHAFNVVDGSEGSKILVTTRDKQLLEERHAQISETKSMQPDASKRLFYNHAFGVGQDCPESLRECAAEIIKLCKNLPLALEIVGSAMAKKKTGVQEWRHEAQTIKENYFLSEEMRGLLQYSYDQLTPVQQECFLTMLSWPADSKISPLMLVPWWRGEDLIGPLSEKGWEEAQGILEALVSRSLILQNSTGLAGIESFFSPSSELEYQIHDVILDLGLDHLLKHESELQKHEQGHIFLSSLKHRQKFIEYARSDPTKLRKVRKISCMSEEELQFEEHASQVLRTSDFPHLKTMIWTPIRSEFICKAIVGTVSKPGSVLKVLMLQMKGLKPLAIELSSGDLQTLDFAAREDDSPDMGTYTFTCLPPNLRWLQLASKRVVLGRPELHLHNLEALKCTSRNVLNVLHFDFKKLSCLVLSGAERGIVVPSLEISNMRCLELSNCANVEPSGGAAHLPKLARLTSKCAGEKWIQMLSGGCPYLTYLDLDLKESFGMVDSVRPPPNLPALEDLRLSALESYEEFWIFRDLQASNLQSSKTGLIKFYKFNQHLPRFVSRLTNLHLIDYYQNQVSVVPGLALVRLNEFLGAPSLPAIVTNVAAPTLQSLQLFGFTLSESEAATLHQLQRLEKLTLGFEGRLPQCLLGLPQAFLHLKELSLRGDFNQEFPRIGEGALPQLQHFEIYGPDGSFEEGVTELAIGVGSANFKLENLKVLIISEEIQFKLLPVEVFISSKLQSLEFVHYKRLEKLVLKPGVEQTIAGCSSLRTLEFHSCDRMTAEGIPEVFKKMHRNGQLEISINGRTLTKIN